MSLGIRLLLPNRMQLRWDTINLDSQLPPDHRARLVWAFVETLDLSELHARIKARDDLPGRPAAEPAVLLALWLYATLDGVGSARASNGCANTTPRIAGLPAGFRPITICSRSSAATAVHCWTSC